ncbi:MAG: cobyric acid synthase [Eubacteriales bacterium]|nr:cobyric acid synthase [Eubacteriales bacterium]
MTKVIMVQGTMSGAGKSLITAGLLRVFKQDGYRAAPFKSQNMALNSYITSEGLEMGRAQVMQAEAAGIEPSVLMNPILLKPTSNVGSQVIVNGEVRGNMQAREYFAHKKELIPDIMRAFKALSDEYDIIVIEGAGSPAEINLKENDIVNMGLAELVDAPVLLVGDIDRGGVFAQLLGTLMLLEPCERDRVKGLVINKFRGDKTILDPGIDMLTEKGGIPTVGVIPYTRLILEDEDSLSERLEKKQPSKQLLSAIDIAVIKLPRISNFTDFDPFEQYSLVDLKYVSSVHELGSPDLIIIPGSKNTIGDLKWMRQNGLEAAVLKAASEGCPVIGICGGYQMLGDKITDPDGVEGYAGASIKGLGLLPVKTVLAAEKTMTQISGKVEHADGIFKELTGTSFEGYEIHMGVTVLCDTDKKQTEHVSVFTPGGTGFAKGSVYGTYVHGFFDKAKILEGIVRSLAVHKGISANAYTADAVLDYRSLREREYDRLAAVIREYMDMDAVYGMLKEAKVQ